MDVGAGLYMYDVVVKSSRSLSHLLMSSCVSSPHPTAYFTFTQRIPGNKRIHLTRCRLLIQKSEVT